MAKRKSYEARRESYEARSRSLLGERATRFALSQEPHAQRVWNSVPKHTKLIFAPQKETYYSVKRDLLQCQKRPTTVSHQVNSRSPSRALQLHLAGFYPLFSRSLPSHPSFTHTHTPSHAPSLSPSPLPLPPCPPHLPSLHRTMAHRVSLLYPPSSLSQSISPGTTQNICTPVIVTQRITNITSRVLTRILQRMAHSPPPTRLSLSRNNVVSSPLEAHNQNPQQRKYNRALSAVALSAVVHAAQPQRLKLLSARQSLSHVPVRARTGPNATVQLFTRTWRRWRDEKRMISAKVSDRIAAGICTQHAGPGAHCCTANRVADNIGYSVDSGDRD